MKNINKGCLLVIIMIAGGTGANIIKEFFGIKIDPLSAAWLSYNIWYMLFGAVLVVVMNWRGSAEASKPYLKNAEEVSHG